MNGPLKSRLRPKQATSNMRLISRGRTNCSRQESWEQVLTRFSCSTPLDWRQTTEELAATSHSQWTLIMETRQDSPCPPSPISRSWILSRFRRQHWNEQDSTRLSHKSPLENSTW